MVVDTYRFHDSAFLSSLGMHIQHATPSTSINIQMSAWHFPEGDASRKSCIPKLHYGLGIRNKVV